MIKWIEIENMVKELFPGHNTKRENLSCIIEEIIDYCLNYSLESNEIELFLKDKKNNKQLDLFSDYTYCPLGIYDNKEIWIKQV